MIVTYFGKQFFKIQQGDMVLAFNPISKMSQDHKSGSTRFGADIAFVTVNHPDYNGLEQLSFGERAPFAVAGPGDYELKEIFIKGLLSPARIVDKNYINTIYAFSVDNINIVFLGALSDLELSEEAREAISSPDVLFVPIGGGNDSVNDVKLLEAKLAAKFALSLEPKMIIPMDYDQTSLKTFLKETGEEKAEVVDKLTLKLKDLEGQEGKVVVLKAI